MPAILEQLDTGERVAVIRLRSLGDCVLTTPALAILKKARPDLLVAVVVEDRFRAVFEGNPDVDELLPPSLPAIARWKPALCLNFHGGTRSMALTVASGARFRAGFAHYRASSLYNVRIPRAQEILGEERVVHTAEHLASAMFFLGAPRQPVPRARLSAQRRPPPRPYAVFHPIASQPEKTWPAHNFAELASYVQQRWGLEPVFIAAAGEDLRPFTRFRVLLGRPLAQVKELIANASLFVGNDSGPAHIAAAFGLPVLVFFGPSDPRVWGPWQTKAVVLHSPADIRSISVSQATEALEQLYGNP